MRKHLSSFGNNQITQIQKSREKRCLHVVPCLNKRSNQLGSLCSQKRERHDQHHGELHSRILKIERGIRRRTALTRGPGQSRPGLSLFIERWAFLLRSATARQVSACHAEAFGVGGLDVEPWTFKLRQCNLTASRSHSPRSQESHTAVKSFEFLPRLTRAF